MSSAAPALVAKFPDVHGAAHVATIAFGNFLGVHRLCEEEVGVLGQLDEFLGGPGITGVRDRDAACTDPKADVRFVMGQGDSSHPERAEVERVRGIDHVHGVRMADELLPVEPEHRVQSAGWCVQRHWRQVEVASECPRAQEWAEVGDVVGVAVTDQHRVDPLRAAVPQQGREGRVPEIEDQPVSSASGISRVEIVRGGRLRGPGARLDARTPSTLPITASRCVRSDTIVVGFPHMVANSRTGTRGPRGADHARLHWLAFIFRTASTPVVQFTSSPPPKVSQMPDTPRRTLAAVKVDETRCDSRCARGEGVAGEEFVRLLFDGQDFFGPGGAGAGNSPTSGPTAPWPDEGSAKPAPLNTGLAYCRSRSRPRS